MPDVLIAHREYYDVLVTHHEYEVEVWVPLWSRLWVGSGNEPIRYKIIHTFEGTCMECRTQWQNREGFDVTGVRVDAKS